MKNVMFGIGLFVIMILGIVSVVTINGQMMRDNQIEEALPEAVESAVEETLMHRQYTVHNNEEFIADFTRILLKRITSDADVEVQVHGVDYEKGLLGVRVICHYKNPNGRDGKQECETTVILDGKDENTEFCNVTFMAQEDVIYQHFQLRKNTKFIVPSNPKEDGKRFVCWRDKETSEQVTAFPEVATEDKTYYAEFQ